jgi:hypothetical protein
VLQCVRRSTKPPRARRVVVMVFSRNGFEQRLLFHHSDKTTHTKRELGVCCFSKQLMLLTCRCDGRKDAVRRLRRGREHLAELEQGE